MRVRITVKPGVHELDGVALDRFVPGTVKDVSPSIGAWLVTEGYAVPEMRSTAREEVDFTDRVKRARETADDRNRPHRRWTDR